MDNSNNDNIQIWYAPTLRYALLFHTSFDMNNKNWCSGVPNHMPVIWINLFKFPLLSYYMKVQYWKDFM